MAYELIRVTDQHGGQVVEITLGPGPGNIVTARLMDEVSVALADLIEPAPRNKGRKLIVFRGEGKHFSYGASVEEHRKGEVADMLPKFHGLLREILECPVPTLAAARGLCLGGGFELVLSCSLLFCTKGARFGVPEIRLGVFPPAASVLLGAKTTEAVACDLILTGRQVSGDDLLQAGLANRVVEDDSLDEALTVFIEEEILPKSASSLRIACRSARSSTVQYYNTHIARAEELYLATLMSTHDANEGIEAFLAKRPPTWEDA